ncbi:MAG: DUF4013 domain-containing protein [Dehalococcoidia bacterium]
MDIGKAFSYVFDDEDWFTKVLIGGLLGLIPIIGTLLNCGYMVELIKNVIDEVPSPLPKWDDWGGKLVKGLVLFVIGLVYFLPLILVWICFGGGVAMIGTQWRELADTLGAIVGVCLGGLGLLYSLVVYVILPAAIARYADTKEVNAALRFGEVVDLVKANFGAYLIVLLLTLVAGIIGSLGTIACFIGALFTMFYAMLIVGHLYGQAYRLSRASTAQHEEGNRS